MTLSEPSDTVPRSPSAPLTRSRENRVVAGVAGGLARYLGIEPAVVQVVFVVLTVAGGSGVALYGLGWLLIPEEGSDRSVAVQLYDRVDGRHNPSTRGLLLLALACGLILFGGLGTRGHWGFPAGVVLLALLAVAAAILVTPRRRERQPSETLSSETVAPWWVWTIGGVLVTLGIVQLLTSLSWGWPILVFLAVGGVVLAGAARRWVGAGFLLVVLLATAAGGAWQAGIGDRLDRPDATASGHRAYHLGVGQLTVDLSDAGLSKLTEVNAHVGVGKLIVVVPPGLSVRMHGSAGIGDVVVFGDHQRGTRVREDLTDGSPVLAPMQISATVGLGQVVVERPPAS
jgi:phage shock protein PspC (stress-responsive transcriptional regulator)